MLKSIKEYATGEDILKLNGEIYATVDDRYLVLTQWDNEVVIQYEEWKKLIKFVNKRLRTKVIKEKHIINEMNERQFGSKVSNKNVFCIFGQGNKVDTQKPDVAIKLMNETIMKFFKNSKPEILMSGRFGQDNKSKTWNFDITMANSGHPSNWSSESRGYYCITNKSLFLFPKDDNFYELYNDFENNVLRGTKIKSINLQKSF